MDEKLIADIKAMVQQIFAEQEESDKQLLTEQALEKSARAISDLTDELATAKSEVETAQEKASSDLEVATAEIESLKVDMAAKDGEIEEAKTKVEEAEAKTTTLETELSEAKVATEKIEKDIETAARMADLDELKIVRSDRDGQEAKVREMDDEAFASYKAELTELRTAVEAELADAQENASDDDASDDGVVTPPVEVDTENAVSAALNMEVTVSDDMKTEYAALGDAMAEALTDK